MASCLGKWRRLRHTSGDTYWDLLANKGTVVGYPTAYVNVQLHAKVDLPRGTRPRHLRNEVRDKSPGMYFRFPSEKTDLADFTTVGEMKLPGTKAVSRCNY